ncbi:hypothetical protein ACFY2M_23155 [Streptomyces sp. NPDC001276]|uniref:hypothetical protein n=1 Tax=Streptomyces sp. NPDC001276 TaxID=3364555 RepID=UPI0036A03C16
MSRPRRSRPPCGDDLVDLLQPGAIFTRAPQLTITQSSLPPAEHRLPRRVLAVRRVWPGKLAFYKDLNVSASATFTNVAFCDAGKNPGSVPGEFYTGLVDAFATWMQS